MNLKKVDFNITEIEKIEAIIQLCINILYDDINRKNEIAYILELVNDKITIIKNDFDNIKELKD